MLPPRLFRIFCESVRRGGCPYLPNFAVDKPHPDISEYFAKVKFFSMLSFVTAIAEKAMAVERKKLRRPMPVNAELYNLTILFIFFLKFATNELID